MRVLLLLILLLGVNAILVQKRDTVPDALNTIQTLQLEQYCTVQLSVSGSSGANINVNVNAQQSVNIPSALSGYSSAVISQGRNMYFYLVNIYSMFNCTEFAGGRKIW